MLGRAQRSKASTTIIRLGTTLGSLPLVTETDFGDLPPWAPITTAGLVAALGIDRGNWATWICRGIGPIPMPSSWFRPSAGRPRAYRLDQVLIWLADRHGDHTDTITIWRSYLATAVGITIEEPEQVRAWAQRFAKSAGPSTGGFTRSGFSTYLDSLMQDNTP